jgi:hypothetical protein
METNVVNKNEAIKKVLPSLILFVLGFAGCLTIFLITIDQPIINVLFGGIVISIMIGWAFGGVVWGLFLTRAWFRPKTVYVKTSNSLDYHDFIKAARPMAWIATSVIVGPFAMIVGFVKLIIVLIKAKKISKMESGVSGN